MALKDSELGEILLAQSYVSEEELKIAKKAAKDRKMELFSILMEKGLLTQSLYEQALAEHYKLPFYDIAETPPSPELIAKLPEEVAREYHAIVVKHAGNSLTVATSDPGEPTLEEAVRLNFEQDEVTMPKKDGKETKAKKTKKTKAKPKKYRVDILIVYFYSFSNKNNAKLKKQKHNKTIRTIEQGALGNLLLIAWKQLQSHYWLLFQ